MSKVATSFAEKYSNWQKIVRQNRGLWGTFLQLFRSVFLAKSHGHFHLTLIN